ncbi:hypothetical protein HU200_020576 [Digitaria exilis]|uniref:Uncharacterized protein n=1 Tax=Digitaria exilis TaxID=1010633 RepID=A0A835F2F2_9POAL|nr:hypothetical protein HU200_020576 [Digitaria exilis]
MVPDVASTHLCDIAISNTIFFYFVCVSSGAFFGSSLTFLYSKHIYLLQIFVRWPCKEDDGLIEAKLLFFSTFYQISLLEVAFQGTLLDVPTQLPPIHLKPPKHGDTVFALGRDKDLSLVVRRGTIVEEQHLDELRQGYLFADYIDGAPGCCTGGPVVDHDGNMVGLSFSGEGEPSIFLPLSTALACVHMWTEFGRIARPLLGMCFRNPKVVDGLSGDIRSERLVVDEVHLNSLPV